MTERLEQQYCIKFCHKLGDSQVETIQKIHTVFGDDAMGITQINEWYNRFKDGRTSVESEPRSGWPSTCRNDQVIARVNAVVMWDRRLTIREIAEEVGLSTFSAYSILTEDLAMKRVSAKLAPPPRQCSSTFLTLDSGFFWQKTRLLCFNRLLTLLIWPPATSGCSTNSRPLKGTRF
jgi:transposase